MNEDGRVTVIGGGSSGMMAAISAARRGARVTLLERKDRVGKKLLATGNGRCNLTNKNSTAPKFHGGDLTFIAKVISCFSAAAAMDFFEELGIACREEAGGRIYPRSGQASAVKHGISRALQDMDTELRHPLKRAGLLTRDSRAKERKKYGQKGARARFQFSKR